MEQLAAGSEQPARKGTDMDIVRVVAAVLAAGLCVLLIVRRRKISD
jgi:hypothetical protein